MGAAELLQKKPGIALFLLQIVFLVLLGLFARYDDHADSGKAPASGKDNDFHPVYPMFQDVHIMIFVGFGFLMTFLKRYGYSSVGFNFLLAALTIQWSILIQGFIHMHMHHEDHFTVDVKSMICGDFAAATILISFGVLLGKASLFQLLIMALFETIFYAVNIHIGEEIFQAADAGGSMFIHTFGAYFGLSCSLVMKQKWYAEHPFEGANYHSDIFAMIGTVFLWICWPSFNGALLDVGEQQHRTAINTYFSLTACVLAAFALSIIVSKKSKLDMVHIQNATIAGGVAIGTMANYMIQPWAAGLMGLLAGTISVLGYHYLTPILARKVGLHDTCGVHNLHGMPGVIAGISGIIAAAMATEEIYGKEGLTKTFHGMAVAEDGSQRTAEGQAAMQAAALGLTLGLAITGGLITGVIMRFLKFLDPIHPSQGYSDMPMWEVPEADGGEEGENEEKMVIVATEKMPLHQ